MSVSSKDQRVIAGLRARAVPYTMRLADAADEYLKEFSPAGYTLRDFLDFVRAQTQPGALHSCELLLGEADRQMVLLALAHLSVERPGWEPALHTLALQIDNQSEGRALMFDEFRRLKK